jgi:hypothetical protein
MLVVVEAPTDHEVRIRRLTGGRVVESLDPFLGCIVRIREADGFVFRLRRIAETVVRCVGIEAGGIAEERPDFRFRFARVFRAMLRTRRVQGARLVAVFVLFLATHTRLLRLLSVGFCPAAGSSLRLLLGVRGGFFDLGDGHFLNDFQLHNWLIVEEACPEVGEPFGCGWGDVRFREVAVERRFAARS